MLLYFFMKFKPFKALFHCKLRLVLSAIKNYSVMVDAKQFRANKLAELLLHSNTNNTACSLVLFTLCFAISEKMKLLPVV